MRNGCDNCGYANDCGDKGKGQCIDYTFATKEQIKDRAQDLIRGRIVW